MSGWNLINPLWWLTRPQQMAFNAGREGAESFENTVHDLDEQFQPSALNTAVAAASSIPAILGGAARAFNPWRDDVSGNELVQGISENPWITAGVGTGMEFGADPLNAGNMGGKFAGTLYRTAKNLRKMKTDVPKAAQALEKMLGWKRFLADIPVAEKGYPVALKDTTLLSHGDLVPQISKTSANLDLLNGINFGNRDLMYIRSQFRPIPDVERTLNHEVAHWTLNPIMNTPEADVLTPLGQQFRRAIANQAHAKEVYGKLSDKWLGNEWFARRMGDGAIDKIPAELAPYAERSRNIASYPGYMEAAPDIPLNAVFESIKAPEKTYNSYSDNMNVFGGYY